MDTERDRLDDTAERPVANSIIIPLLILAAIGIGGLVIALMPSLYHPAHTRWRTASGDNVKQIMLALQNYHDANGHFPPAYSTDENGKPLLSWRVLILPYIESKSSNAAFHLHEPWDSPHNLAAAEVMPAFYRSPADPGAKSNPLHTSYLLFTGAGTAFEGGKTASFGDIADGISNTLGCVEVINTGIVWTQPSDLEVAKLDFLIHGPRDAKPGQINAPSDQGFIAGFFDGSWRFLPHEMPPEQLRALCGIRDGVKVEMP